MYAFSENFVLPISHDEVVHGKGSLLAQDPGDRATSSSRRCGPSSPTCGPTPASSCCSWAASSRSEPSGPTAARLDWWLLDQPAHYRVHALVKDLNRVYQEHPAMWALDTEPAGFRWLDADDNTGNVLVVPALRARATSRATSSRPSSTTAATTRRGLPRRRAATGPVGGHPRHQRVRRGRARRARPVPSLEAEAPPWDDQQLTSVTVRRARPLRPSLTSPRTPSLTGSIA